MSFYFLNLFLIGQKRSVCTDKVGGKQLFSFGKGHSADYFFDFQLENDIIPLSFTIKQVCEINFCQALIRLDENKRTLLIRLQFQPFLSFLASLEEATERKRFEQIVRSIQLKAFDRIVRIGGGKYDHGFLGQQRCQVNS